MYVWVFQGFLGEGKTFGMSVFALYYKYRARRAGIQVDLYANYDLLGARPLRHYRDFYEVARSPNSICLIDEAHVNLDARQWAKASNIYLTQFIFYLRKLRSSLFLATPHIRNLDTRIRNLTNILVDCHKLGGSFMYDIYDYQAQRLLRRKFMPKHVAERLFALKLYDTHALIRAFEFPNSERSFDEFLEKLISIREEAEKKEEEVEEVAAGG